MSDALERAARAGDHEDSAQRGEPSPWSEAVGGADDPVFVQERRAVYREAITAFLNPSDEAMETIVAAAMAPEIFAALTSCEKISDAYRLSHDAREFRQYARAAIAALRDSLSRSDATEGAVQSPPAVPRD